MLQIYSKDIRLVSSAKWSPACAETFLHKIKTQGPSIPVVSTKYIGNHGHMTR